MRSPPPSAGANRNLALPGLAPPVEPRKPSESSISEGNLAEHPLFVLTNKEAKPLDENNKIRLADYTKTLLVSSDVVAGERVDRQIVMKANPQYGYPTMFAYRVLLAIIDEAHRAGLTSAKVHINRYQIATRLGYRRPSTANYNDIVNALNALISTHYEFTDTWHVRSAKSNRGRVSTEGLVYKFDFDDRSPNPGTKGVHYVILGETLFKSLAEGYFNGVDLDYMNALQSPLAQRLYVYLSKKDAQKTVYVEGLQGLAAKLNLKKRKPSALYDALAPALTLLEKEIPVGDSQQPRRFLESWEIDADRKNMHVTFFRPGSKDKRGVKGLSADLQEKIQKIGAGKFSAPDGR